MNNSHQKQPITTFHKLINYFCLAILAGAFVYIGFFFNEFPQGEIIFGFAGILAISYGIICFVSPYPEMYNLPIRITERTRNEIYGLMVWLATFLKIYMATLVWAVAIKVFHYDGMFAIYFPTAIVGLITIIFVMRKMLKDIRRRDIGVPKTEVFKE